MLGKMTLLAAVVACSSCSKDDDNNNYVPVNQTPNNASYITGKVDGADFSTIIFGTSTAQSTRVGAGDSTQTTVFGGDLAANSITISLWNVNSTGTYTINNESESVLNYSPGSGGVAYSTGECAGATGTVTVTYLDATKIEGTFSFEGIDTENCAGGHKTVTEGSFRGTFQN